MVKLILTLLITLLISFSSPAQEGDLEKFSLENIKFLKAESYGYEHDLYDDSVPLEDWEVGEKDFHEAVPEELDDEALQQFKIKMAGENDDPFDFEKEVEKVEKVSKNKKKTNKKILKVKVAVDSEYQDKDFISLQVHAVFELDKEKTITQDFLVLSKEFESLFTDSQLLEFEKKYDFKLVIAEYDSESSFLIDILCHFIDETPSLKELVGDNTEIRVDLYFYYSWKDLEFSFGSAKMLPYYNGKAETPYPLSQKRNIKGLLLFDGTLFGDIIKCLEIKYHNCFLV